MSRATLPGSPGTASSSSRLAARKRSGLPKWFSKRRLRAGPAPYVDALHALLLRSHVDRGFEARDCGHGVDEQAYGEGMLARELPGEAQGDTDVAIVVDDGAKDVPAQRRSGHERSNYLSGNFNTKRLAAPAGRSATLKYNVTNEHRAHQPLVEEE